MLGIASSPFSGAGVAPSMMLRIHARPGGAISQREASRGSGMSAGPDFPFGNFIRKSLFAPFAEAFMLHTSANAYEVDVCFRRDLDSGSVFSTFASAFMRSKIGQTLLRAYFTVLRRWSWAAWRARSSLRPGRERRGERPRSASMHPMHEVGCMGSGAMCEPSCTSRSSLACASSTRLQLIHYLRATRWLARRCLHRAREGR